MTAGHNLTESARAGLERELAGIVGSTHVVPGEVVRARPVPWDTHQPCRAWAVVEPGSTDEVAAVLRACNAARQSVVTLGGVTNLVQACRTGSDDVALSLARMNRVEDVDARGRTLTAQAGCTLREAQLAAERAGLLYPVDIGARDNCTLGGNVATNAGGTRVIRYGMTRDAVLGLEAVLADGTVLASMNRYIKNNSGYDLKQLFIGSEGTLGVVTRVVMRLASKPLTHNVALLGCRGFADVVAVLGTLQARLGADLCGFEVMWDSFFDQVTGPDGRHPSPLPGRHACYVLVEAMGTRPGSDDDHFAGAMEALFDSEQVADGVIAKSGTERDRIWAIRHDVEWIVTGAQNFDVSLRVTDVSDYVECLTAVVKAQLPDATVAAFGHLGDNNLHVSVVGAADDESRRFVEECVYENLRPFAGAISAEHGIGLEKRAWLPVSRSAAEIDAMRALKRHFDPLATLNPGKVVGAP